MWDVAEEVVPHHTLSGQTDQTIWNNQFLLKMQCNFNSKTVFIETGLSQFWQNTDYVYTIWSYTLS